MTANSSKGYSLPFVIMSVLLGFIFELLPSEQQATSGATGMVLCNEIAMSLSCLMPNDYVPAPQANELNCLSWETNRTV